TAGFRARRSRSRGRAAVGARPTAARRRARAAARPAICRLGSCRAEGAREGLRVRPPGRGHGLRVGVGKDVLVARGEAVDARRLRDTTDPVEAIARSIGYMSEYAFNRAF